MAESGQRTSLKVDLWDYQAKVDLYSALQARLQEHGESFSVWAQALWGHSMAVFMASGSGHEEMGLSWEPKRALGEGGFGKVALWQKRDEDSHVLEEIAIKETRFTPGSDLTPEADPTMSWEALLMKQLNDVEHRSNPSSPNRYILRLRSFKYFPSHIPRSHRWRFYLEFAPWGDLYKLIWTYRAWRTYLPEEFLWHVLFNLAASLQFMRLGRFHDPDGKIKESNEIVHFDIKPENIFLAEPGESSKFVNYPILKLADFGLATITSQVDPQNPSQYLPYGTPGYKPPEQTKFTSTWRHPPNASPPDSVKFSWAHNVWAVGKVMYDMMNLCYPDDLEYQMQSTTEDKYYGDLREHAIPPITTFRDPEYSQRLRDLVRSCLHLRCEKRPDPVSLLHDAYHALRWWGNESDYAMNGPRLYFRGHEINRMPKGNARLRMTREQVRKARDAMVAHPTWEPLLSGCYAKTVRRKESVRVLDKRAGKLSGKIQKRQPTHSPGSVSREERHRQAQQEVDFEIYEDASHRLEEERVARKTTGEPTEGNEVLGTKQAATKRKRKRVFGLSFDGEPFHEPEGRQVHGHNLRKRRAR